ncbi:Nn.00g079380.m01.CDS01 [Neocucurbitaria sp. VM-36]
MRLHLFKSKKWSTPKGNTLKKTPPPVYCPESDFPGVDADGFILSDILKRSYPRDNPSMDIAMGQNKTKQDNFVAAKELTKECSSRRWKKPGLRESIVHRMRADPYHAILMDDMPLGMKTDMNSSELKMPAAPLFSVDPIVPWSSLRAQIQQSSMQHLMLGLQDAASRYLTRRFASMPNLNHLTRAASTLPTFLPKNGDNSSPLHLTEYDPHAFELYKTWLHTGTIPTHLRDTCFSPYEQNRNYTWQTSWPLINAVILGHTISTPDFTDRVMDLLSSKILKSVCADSDTVIHLFTQTTEAIPDTLKQFIIDRCIDAGFDNFKDLDIQNLPKAFLERALETALKRLSYAGQVELVPGCEYHTHEKLEGCYKRKGKPAEISRIRRSEVRRERSRNESVKMAKNFEHDGVTRIDWEERRNAARKAAGRRVQGRKTDVVAGTGQAEEIASTNGAASTRRMVDHGPARLVQSAAIPDITRTNGVAEKMQVEQPSGAPPLGFVELPGNSAAVRHPIRTPQIDQKNLTIKVNGSVGATVGRSGSDSLYPKTSMAQSHQDSGLAGKADLDLAYRKSLLCPGAFPDSRSGSLRDITPSDEYQVKRHQSF